MDLAFIALLASASLFPPLPEEKPQRPPLQNLLSPSEWNRHQRKCKYPDRMDLFRLILDRRVRLLERYLKQRHVDQAVELMAEVRSLVHYAIQEASQVKNPKDLRSREIKKLEILLRKLVETIGNLKRSVPFPFRAEFELTARKLEAFRNQLLIGIFGLPLMPRRTSHSRPIDQVDEPTFSFLLRKPLQQNSRPFGDRFTEEEFVELQENQELTKRVQIFLTIAERRLSEIRRRMHNKSWETTDENPLELHTYRDIMHAYERAIDGIMIKIDEKSLSSAAPEKRIRKALETLQKSIDEMLPQLSAIKNFAIETQDEELYQEVLKAENTSTIARKGTQFGLKELSK